MSAGKENSKDAFVGKVLSEIMTAVSELQVRSKVLTKELARLRAEVGDESYEAVVERLEKEVKQAYDRQLDDMTERFSSGQDD